MNLNGIILQENPFFYLRCRCIGFPLTIHKNLDKCMLFPLRKLSELPEDFFCLSDRFKGLCGFWVVLKLSGL